VIAGDAVHESSGLLSECLVCVGAEHDTARSRDGAFKQAQISNAEIPDDPLGDLEEVVDRQVVEV
jgi:hypothetical protein